MNRKGRDKCDLDPLLTIEQQGGKYGQAGVSSTKEILELGGIG